MLFLDTDDVNTVGNAYATMELMMSGNPALVEAAANGSVSSTSAEGGGPRQLLGHQQQQQRQQLQQQQQLLQQQRSGSGSNSGSASGAHHPPPPRRRLSLQLKPLPYRPTNASQQQFSFNILTVSRGSADAMLATLKSADGRAAVASSVAADLASATNNATQFSVEVPDSASLVTLTYMRSLWSLLWEWFARNIFNVLAGGCALIAVSLLLACYGRCKRAREAAAAARKEAALAARLAALHEGARAGSARAGAAWEAGRWARVRRGLLAYLKHAVFQRVAGVVVGGEQQRRAAAGAAAAVAAAAAAAAAVRAGGGGGGRRGGAGIAAVASVAARATQLLKARSLAAIGKGKAVLMQGGQLRLGGEEAVVAVGGPPQAAAAAALRQAGRETVQPQGGVRAIPDDSQKVFFV